jgi:hypothetical protein
MMLKRPDLLLKDAGWKPVNPSAHPNETEWIDPLGSHSRYELIKALQIQYERDFAESVMKASKQA